ncbi:unnamed protein product, partial [Diplocarpon coronariae]
MTSGQDLEAAAQDSSSSSHSPKAEIDTANDSVPANADTDVARDENFYTRNGLNLESFKQRSYGRGIVQLDRSMKGRHLHMIAIGGSIGAGFF